MTPKTVKVRVAVAVDEDGAWSATGGHDVRPRESAAMAAEDLEPQAVRIFYLTATLPIPDEPEVEAEGEG